MGNAFAAESGLEGSLEPASSRVSQRPGPAAWDSDSVGDRRLREAGPSDPSAFAPLSRS